MRGFKSQGAGDRKTIHVHGEWKELPIRILVEDQLDIRIGGSDERPVKLVAKIDDITELEVYLTIEEGIVLTEILRHKIEEYMQARKV